jgi:diguanylate cyclase (GGDEF)-like protein/PAS domain S-box-containing protein
MLPLIAGIGVRPQLSLVVLIAILPLLAVLLVGVIKNRQLILEAATTRAVDLARFGAEQQDAAFQDAENVLRALRSMPRLAEASAEDCHATLQAIGKEYPQFTSIGLIDATGTIYCLSTGAKPRPVHNLEQLAAARAADPQSFIFGKFAIGLVTGKPVIAVSTPLPTTVKDGQPPVVAYVGVDLDRAARHAWDSGGSVDAVLCLIDAQTATILARSSSQLSLAGTKIEGSPLVAAMLAHPAGGSVEAVDVDGTLRIFGFAPLGSGGGAGFMVAVGLPRAAVLAAANWRLMLGVMVALLTAVVAAAAAWVFADRTQFRAIRSLVETARKLGAGDLDARADLAALQAPEFRALGKTLDDMAGGIARTQENLSASDRKLRLLADNSTDMIMLVRPGGQCAYASPACRALLGYEPEEMLAIVARQAIHPDDLRLLDDRRKRNGESAATSTYRLRRKDGSYVWVESVARTIPPAPGEPPEQLVVVRNIDQRIAAEQRLRESEMRYRFLAENVADVVFQYDLDLVRQYVSPACRDVLGYEPEELIGRRAFGTTHSEDVDEVAQTFDAVRSGELERAVVANRMRRRDGGEIWVETQLRLMRDEKTGAPLGVVGSLRDISIRKAAEDKLEEANRRLEALAGQDGLTGLANRRTFDDALSREHRRALRERSRLAMLMIDVDWFKAFNDRYGHPAGDECLKRVSRAIENTLPRPGDLVARFGGEEFAVLLPNTDEAAAAVMADRIRRAVLALAIEHDACPALVVTISAGVAAFAPTAFELGFDSLVRRADQALYRAKHLGRNMVACASALEERAAGDQPNAA